ncbi:hypothetical protein VLF92_13480, partial [Pseudomonas chengduensis]
IGENFPDNQVIFGEVAYERIKLPVPPIIYQSDDMLNEMDFTACCLVSLLCTAKGMKSGETLVILLISHGCTKSTAGEEE